MWWEAIAIEAAENEWYELEVLVIAKELAKRVDALMGIYL